MDDLLENISYGDLLETDPEFVNVMDDLKESLNKMRKHLDVLLPMRAHYDKMDLPQKIEFDITLSYMINGYYWVYLRLIGVDPEETNIKIELDRTKEAMKKWNELKEKSKRPTLNLQAAKRFIKSGLYDRFKGTGDLKRMGLPNEIVQPLNKKIKFKDDD